MIRKRNPFLFLLEKCVCGNYGVVVSRSVEVKRRLWGEREREREWRMWKINKEQEETDWMGCVSVVVSPSWILSV